MGYLLQVLAKRFEAGLTTRMKDRGMEFKHISILRVLLQETDGIPQKEFGRRVSYPEYKISRVIDALEKEGFVQRKPSPTSRRRTLVSLTPLGQETAKLLPQTVGELNTDMLAKLTKSERAEFLRLLQKLHAVTG